MFRFLAICVPMLLLAGCQSSELTPKLARTLLEKGLAAGIEYPMVYSINGYLTGGQDLGGPIPNASCLSELGLLDSQWRIKHKEDGILARVELNRMPALAHTVSVLLTKPWSLTVESVDQITKTRDGLRKVDYTVTFDNAVLPGSLCLLNGLKAASTALMKFNQESAPARNESAPSGIGPVQSYRATFVRDGLSWKLENPGVGPNWVPPVDETVTKVVPPENGDFENLNLTYPYPAPIKNHPDRRWVKLPGDTGSLPSDFGK